MPAYSRVFPFLAWGRELRDPAVLRADLVAGISVALVLIPQAMAYAQLAGLPPYYGLYAAFLPPILAALWGSSRQLSTGPVAVVSLMTAAALAPFAAQGQNLVPLAIGCALLAGVFQLTLGLLRLGVVVNFLSHPVIVGFTNAAAIVIATSQLDKVLGVRADKASSHVGTVWNALLSASHGVYWPAVGMAALAFAIMIIAKRFDRRIPGVLLAVAVTTIIAWRTAYHDEATVELARLRGSAAAVASECLDERGEAKRLGETIATAERSAAALRSELGAVDVRAVQARLDAEVVKLRKEEQERDAARHFAALRSMRFRRAGDGKEAVFHPLGEIPAGLPDDGREWRLRTLGDDSRILMVTGGNIVGTVPAGLPTPGLPRLGLGELLHLVGMAIVLALVGFVEAISIAKAMAMRTRQRLDPDQELIGQGLANLAGGLTGAYPVSGSFSRSAVNIQAGARTGFASVVTGVAVALTLLCLTPLLYYLPEATLAAVIMMAVASLVKVAPITHAWKTNRVDALVAIVTCVVTLALAPNLDLGIAIGVALSLFAYLAVTMKPRIAILARHPDGSLRDAPTHGLEQCRHVVCLRFDGRLYFANTTYFEDAVIRALAVAPEAKALLVMAQGINGLDASGEEMLDELTARLDRQGVRLLLCGVKQQVRLVLDGSGWTTRHGADRLLATEDEALEAAWKAVGCDHRERCPLLNHQPAVGASG